MSATRLPGSGVYAPYPVIVKVVSAALPASIGTVVVANTTGVLTVSVAHGLNIGDAFVLGTMTNGAPYTAGTTYYVQSVPSPTTLTGSATPGGALLATSQAGSSITIQKSTVFTAFENDHVSIDTTTRGMVSNLPVGATLVPGAAVKFINVGSSNTATVRTVDGTTINGVAGLTGDATMSSQYSQATFRWDGANWLKF